MAQERKGCRLALSPARKMVMEILHHGRQVPSLPLSTVINVGALAAARKAGAFVSWTAIFMKAYSLTAQRHAELRRAYIPLPWPHLYEHAISECAILMERELDGESIVLGGKVRSPDLQTLPELDAALRRYRETPIHQVGHFRQWLRLGRLPALLRRFIFWTTLYISGWKRAKRFGTFIISSLGNLGVEQHHPVAPFTTYLTFGPISASGEVNVKIIYDHRVMDGRTVARCLNSLEEMLNTQILQELTDMIPGRAPLVSADAPAAEELGSPVAGALTAGFRSAE